MATSGGGNHCDPCFILDEIKVDSSSMCRECRHQLCDKCVEHHRRTIATRDHVIMPFQHTETYSAPVNKQRPIQQDQSGKLDIHTAVTEKYTGSDTHSTFEVSGRRAQHETRLQENTADTQRHASSTKQQSEFLQYEVSGRRVTGSESADQDQTGPEEDRRLMWDGDQATGSDSMDQDQATGSDSVDQDQVVSSSMKNMRLDAGTSTTQTTRQTGKPYTTITLKNILNVKRENDRNNCEITGLVVLQDKLIVCECNNHKLKVVNSSYRFLYEYKCDDKPSDIAMLDVNTVVVSSYLGRNMRLFSVGNDSMKEISKINTGYGCYGVCCYGGKIYCAFPGIGVRVYRADGQLLHNFEHLSDGKVEYKDLNYITINPQTGILYVTDVYKGVLALSTSGDVIAVMSPQQLELAKGIAVDDNGHIYVCEYWSNNVIQMSADGRNIAEIMSSKNMCHRPRCVKIYGNKIYLSHRYIISGNDIVAIYQLS